VQFSCLSREFSNDVQATVPIQIDMRIRRAEESDAAVSYKKTGQCQVTKYL